MTLNAVYLNLFSNFTDLALAGAEVIINVRTGTLSGESVSGVGNLGQFKYLSGTKVASNSIHVGRNLVQTTWVTYDDSDD